MLCWMFCDIFHKIEDEEFHSIYSFLYHSCNIHLFQAQITIILVFCDFTNKFRNRGKPTFLNINLEKNYKPRGH